MPFENGEIASKDPSSKIKILSAMEAIKKRPDMYMPNYKQNGVRQMVMAVFDNFFAPFGNRAFEVDIGLVVVNAFCKNLWWYDHHSELHYQNGIFKSENFSCKFMSFGFIQMTLEPIDEISFEGP